MHTQTQNRNSTRCALDGQEEEEMVVEKAAEATVGGVRAVVVRAAAKEGAMEVAMAVARVGVAKVAVARAVAATAVAERCRGR